MNLRRAKNRNVLLDITPMIDVVFLLLIFFMVSTTFDQNSELNITLPQADEEVKSSSTQAIHVAIDPYGKVFVNKKPLPDNEKQTIQDALSDAAIGIDNPPVIIHADADATHQSVIRVMDASRNVKLTKVTFAVKREPGL